jgi:hypothetical protein
MRGHCHDLLDEGADDRSELGGAALVDRRGLWLAQVGRLRVLEAGKQRDFIVWDVEWPASVAYFVGTSPAVDVDRRGCRAGPSLPPTH